MIKTLAFVLLTVVGTTAFGQDYFGLRVGTNTVDITKSDADHKMTRFIGGVTAEHFVGDNFSIGADLLYNQRGGNSVVTASDLNSTQRITSKLRYDYLSIPLKASAYFTEKKLLFVSIGLMPSFVVHATVTSPTYTLGGTTYPGSTRKANELQSFDLSAQIEAGLNFPINEKYSFFLLGSFQRGFTKVYKGNAFFDGKVYNYGIVSTVGVKMKLQ
ncbi:MAG: outer membrane beta-barrel protein [Bacteroidota bacterium]